VLLLACRESPNARRKEAENLLVECVYALKYEVYSSGAKF
jgi:hypothetical protein